MNLDQHIKKIHNFLEILFRITKSKDIKIYKKLWYEEMLKNIKNALYLFYLYIKLTTKIRTKVYLDYPYPKYRQRPNASQTNRKALLL